MSDIYRQVGGQPNLGLAEIDEHLDYDGKSVERISDPEFRLFVLWTCIGQYRAAADRIRQDLGEDTPTVNDARHHQLVSRWAIESRRVYPDIRQRDLMDGFVNGIYDHLDKGMPLAAYMEILDLRSDCPDYIHPDVRFDLMVAICNNTTDLHPEDSFKPMVVREMLDETVPGGIGYCDDAERLRRYHNIAMLDDSMPDLASDFIGIMRADRDVVNSDYFDFNTRALSEVLYLVVERGYSELALHLISLGVLDFEEEAMLLEIL